MLENKKEVCFVDIQDGTGCLVVIPDVILESKQAEVQVDH
jgi:hypothetical protein